MALVFYGALVAAALGWVALAGRPLSSLLPGSAGAVRAAISAGLGLALGLLVVGLSRALLAWTAWGRGLFAWFAGVLGPLSAGEVAVLAASSAVGEELFFRGAMQPALGLLATSGIFAALHLPQRLRYLPWTASAAALGLAFGLLAQRTGDLGGAIVAHAVINGLNLYQVARVARVARGDGPSRP